MLLDDGNGVLIAAEKRVRLPSGRAALTVCDLMPSYDATTARCTVLTFKEGLLSKVAHDLKIVVDRLEVNVEADGGAVRATFDTDSLRVECARNRGVDAPHVLSTVDKHTIERNIQEEVLHCRRYPRATFTSTRIVENSPSQRRIEGDLELHGHRRTIQLDATLEAGRWNAEVTLDQRDFGIAPFRAMLGALRIRPEVRIQLSLPAG